MDELEYDTWLDLQLEHIKLKLINSLGKVVSTPKGDRVLVEIYCDGNVACLPTNYDGDYFNNLEKFNANSVQPKQKEGMGFYVITENLLDGRKFLVFEDDKIKAIDRFATFYFGPKTTVQCSELGTKILLNSREFFIIYEINRKIVEL